MTLVIFNVAASSGKSVGFTVAIKPNRVFWENKTLNLPDPTVETFWHSVIHEMHMVPTGPEWCWEVTVTIPGVGSITEYVLVPDATIIHYRDLVRVDPESLEVQEPEKEWWARLEAGLKSAAPGPQGEKGDRGDPGPRGERGPSGLSIRGETGATGAPGQTGPQGIQGIQGVKGDKGDKGDKGEKGDTGSRGSDGTSVQIKGTVSTAAELPTGAALGDGYIVSATGHLHVYSPTGWIDAGEIKGPKGDPGERGPQGNPGIKGDKGETGAQGIQGIAGPTGLTGAQGIQGVKGDKGDTGPIGARGDTGLTGATGSTGPIGPEGPQGLQGEKGDTGARGLQGIAGTAGAKGDKGDKGDTGPVGPMPSGAHAEYKNQLSVPTGAITKLGAIALVTVAGTPNNNANIFNVATLGRITFTQAGTYTILWFVGGEGSLGDTGAHWLTISYPDKSRNLARVTGVGGHENTVFATITPAAGESVEFSIAQFSGATKSISSYITIDRIR